MNASAALIARVEELAADVGRLHRRVNADPDSSLAHLVDRIAGHVESLDAVLQPTAAELYREFFLICGDYDGVALDEALAVTERRQQHFRAVLQPPRLASIRAAA